MTRAMPMTFELHFEQWLSIGKDGIQRKECTLLYHKTKVSWTSFFFAWPKNTFNFPKLHARRRGLHLAWLAYYECCRLHYIHSSIRATVFIQTAVRQTSKYYGSPGLWSPAAPHINVFTGKHHLASLSLSTSFYSICFLDSGSIEPFDILVCLISNFHWY